MYYSRLLFIWISAFFVIWVILNLMKQSWVCKIMLKLRMKKVCHINVISHVNFKGLKLVGENMPVSTFSQSIRKWIRKINPGLFFMCVPYSCPWKEERLTNQDFGDSLTSIKTCFPCLASLRQHSWPSFNTQHSFKSVAKKESPHFCISLSSPSI